MLEAELERAKMEESQKDDDRPQSTTKENDIADEENKEILLGVSAEGRRPSRFSVSTVTDKKQINLSPTPPKSILKKHDGHSTINGTPFKNQLSPTQSISSLSAADRWR